MQTRNITPNQTVSTPSLCTSGMKIGNVISIMLTCSTNRPRKISISIIAAIRPIGGSPSLLIDSTTPLLAPENDRICEKVVAPRMMNRIIPEMLAVPRSASTRFCKESAR